MIEEFKKFVMRGNVIDLAVGFIMGLYLGGLVQALVKDFLLPAIGLAIPGINDLASYKPTVAKQTFGVGDFLVALITFIIVALVIFLIVKIADKWGME